MNIDGLEKSKTRNFFNKNSKPLLELGRQEGTEE